MNVAYKTGEITDNLYSIITDINCSMQNQVSFFFFFLEIATRLFHLFKLIYPSFTDTVLLCLG